MKKLLLSIAIFSSVCAKSQTTLDFSFCFDDLQTTYMDSVRLSAILNASAGYQGIVFSEISGPNTAIFETPFNTFKNTFWEKSTQWVKGLVPGTYIFQATGSSLNNATTSTFMDTVSILALPVIPAPPVITGVTIPFMGQVFTIPSGQGTKITYTYNGITQTVSY